MYDSATALRLEVAISKITPFLVAALLLLPFVIIFWRMACYQPPSESEVRAQLQKTLDEATGRAGWQQSEEIDKEPAMSIETAVVSMEYTVGLTSRTARWLHLYPRRWVGFVGLLSIMVLLALVGFSSWFRAVPPVQLSKTRTSPGPAYDSGTSQGSWGPPPDIIVVPPKDQGKKE